MVARIYREPLLYLSVFVLKDFAVKFAVIKNSNAEWPIGFIKDSILEHSLWVLVRIVGILTNTHNMFS